MTIPFTRMRQRYRSLSGLNTGQQLAMARATNAADLAADFAHSVAAFQTYSNGEPFYETGRKPLNITTLSAKGCENPWPWHHNRHKHQSR